MQNEATNKETVQSTKEGKTEDEPDLSDLDSDDDPDDNEVKNQLDRVCGEYEIISTTDERFKPREAIVFYPFGRFQIFEHGHSPVLPAWNDNCSLDDEEKVCPDDIVCEVVTRSGRQYLLCFCVDFVYAQDCETLKKFDVFNEQEKFCEKIYDNMWDEMDREDCQIAWKYKNGEILDNFFA